MQPLVIGSTPSEILRSTDIFRLKTDNIKELETNRSVGGKSGKTKADPSAAVVVTSKQSVDVKALQNINKINNNAIDIQSDEVQRVDMKINKSKTMTAVSATANVTPKSAAESKTTQKSSSGSNVSDVANKSNNNVTNATAPKSSAKESTKKKSKEKDQKAVEEKRRLQEEEDERKRLELIAAQRKAKLVDQNSPRPEQVPKRNNLAASIGKCNEINVQSDYVHYLCKRMFVRIFQR